MIQEQRMKGLYSIARPMKTALGMPFILLVLSVLFDSASGQALQKIRIGYPSISSRQAQLWVAKNEGLFRNDEL
jgi:hypothetical protein